jgi:ferrous iron transport protein A
MRPQPLDPTPDRTVPADNDSAPDPATAKAFPLALAQDGERLRIAAVRSGKGLSRKLGTLGLKKGSQLTVAQRQRGGAVVVSQGANRVALGAATAQMILVTLVDGDGTTRP